MVCTLCNGKGFFSSYVTEGKEVTCVCTLVDPKSPKRRRTRTVNESEIKIKNESFYDSIIDLSLAIGDKRLFMEYVNKKKRLF